MRNTFALFGMAGLTAMLISSTAFAQKSDEVKQSKNTRHIKMTKIENGKKMELDTVLTGDDIFIWNGDTLNPEKHIRKFSPSGFDKMHRIDVEVENKDGNEEDRLIYLNGPDMKHFPPMPPMPPMPHVKMLKGPNTGHIIDLNDPNIISFKKKKLSGDREKIEIIRKKSEGPENMTFDFEIDDAVMAPEPPEPPVFINEFNNEENGRKIIRKEIKVEEKKDKKIEEETAP